MTLRLTSAMPATGTEHEQIFAVARDHAPRSLYVHVPFCAHKCHYCDFYSIVDARDRQEAFTGRLIEELQASSPYLHGPLETVFVGGGTPTLLAPEQWQSLLQAIAAVGLGDNCEFTVEANPETVTSELLDVLVSGGVNRLSLGAQSFDHRHLVTLERRHDPASVARSVRRARAAGLVDVNLDLIFAIPGQQLDDWRLDLERALELDPTHLSCYGLMYEPNTPLTARLRAGVITRADDELEAAMYELALDRLDEAGYEHYEISNWCRSGRACAHNLVYWTNGDWWPLGPSAAGHVGGVRWRNVPRLGEYLDVGPLPPVMDVERLDEDGRVGEQFMLGLRLREGLAGDRVEALLAQGHRGRARSRAIERFVHEQLLERAGGHLRLTRRGLMLADSVLAELL